ncbi:hypothetical protein FA15DRAFT_663495 [Coprinopsis marcescibilis]|uniref:Uncharacterized protein n=1 Tax=Coprinopsis marcescibilis TaxID=230819 RepID=A0A5C3LN31_COPMA|nr:hypothetical protein FA15DRAFT_663495 [Coprinopsis marcescibilis]
MSLIPEPDVNPLGMNFRSLKPLEKLMESTHTKSQFLRFKEIVLQARFRSSLPKDKVAEELDSEDWNAFVQKVLRNLAFQKLLATYENSWPIKCYWNWLSQKEVSRKINLTYKFASSEFHKTSTSMPHRRTKNPAEPKAKFRSSGKKKVFIGAPPPGVPPNKVRYLSEALRQRSGFGQSNTEPLVPEALPFNVGCIQCDLLPDYPSRVDGQLKKMFPNPKHLQLMRNLGIGTDLHLAIFLKWSRDLKKRLLNHLLPGEITTFEKLQLLRMVSEAVEKPDQGLSRGQKRTFEECGGAGSYQTSTPETPPAAKRRFSHIAQPSAAEEELITNPESPLLKLQECMELKHNLNLFNATMDEIKAGSREYLEIYHPTSDAFEQTVSAIAATRLLFEKYENNWPIRFYIKRRARALGNRPVDELGRVRDFGASFLGINESSQAAILAQCPGSSIQPPATPSSSRVPPQPLASDINDIDIPQILSGCIRHPKVDLSVLSNTVKRFLIHRGVIDLIPAFALVGVTTRKDFTEFTHFSEEEKFELFSDPRVVRLRPFQRMALQLEFTPQKMAPFSEIFAQRKD